MGLTYKCLISFGCLALVEGYSVNEVMETYEKVTHRKAVIEYTGRRLGPPARLVASPHYEELVWKAEYSLEPIIESAWKWHRRKRYLLALTWEVHLAFRTSSNPIFRPNHLHPPFLFLLFVPCQIFFGKYQPNIQKQDGFLAVCFFTII
jgi:hypothetical protein